MIRSRVMACALLALLLSSNSVAAQDTTFRTQSNVVLAPALVLDRSGGIVRGLNAEDFVIEENGAEQRVRLDESPEAEGLSLVVAVQRGRSAYLQLEGWRSAETTPTGKHKKHEAALGGLGEMVENLIGDSPSEVAVVSFDSSVDTLQRFTTDVVGATERFKDLTGSGDGCAAILDAVDYSVEMLSRRPKGKTRVLLLISEERDHGSRTRLEDILPKVASSGVLIYSISFSPLRSESSRQWSDPTPSAGGLIKLLGLAVDAFGRNSSRAVAELTGGEYAHYSNKKGFDAEMGELANHVRGRYLLSFEPSNAAAGPHRFTVRLRHPREGWTVVARNSYWIVEK